MAKSSIELKFSTTGIKENYRAMVEESKWNIAVPDLGTSLSNLQNTPAQFYVKERGTNSDENHPNIWRGNIGLMYPSDYGYMTSGENTTGREQCLSLPITNWHATEDHPECYQNTWIYNSSVGDYWTMISDARNNISVIRIMNTTDDMNGSIRYRGAELRHAVLPVLYLKNTVKITSGEGTSDDPYLLPT